MKVDAETSILLLLEHQIFRSLNFLCLGQELHSADYLGLVWTCKLKKFLMGYIHDEICK
jgi:hypothetical protein